MTHHECWFPEVRVGRREASDVLPEGTNVLAPCACGETPLDAMSVANATLDETARAFADWVAAGDTPLYHWTPTRHRRQIIRRGLVPGRRQVTHPDEPGVHGWRAPYVCFADTPSMAWALSGAQPSAPSGEWDLWQTWLRRLDEPLILTSLDTATRGIHEVRTGSRVYKRDLWLVGSRTKDPA